jgi:hypothetical protein
MMFFENEKIIVPSPKKGKVASTQEKKEGV